MQRQNEILRQLAEDIRPLQEQIERNMHEVEQRQRAERETQQRRKLAEHKFRSLAWELVAEADIMVQRLCDGVLRKGVQVDAEYPTEGVDARCVVQIEPTADFPQPFCFALRFPHSPNLEDKIELQVTLSDTADQPGEVVSATHISPDDCDRRALREWVSQGIAAAVRRYFEMRASHGGVPG
jgi:hypothetical protein